MAVLLLFLLVADLATKNDCSHHKRQYRRYYVNDFIVGHDTTSFALVASEVKAKRHLFRPAESLKKASYVV